MPLHFAPSPRVQKRPRFEELRKEIAVRIACLQAQPRAFFSGSDSGAIIRTQALKKTVPRKMKAKHLVVVGRSCRGHSRRE